MQVDARDFSLLPSILTGCGAHSASYSIGIWAVLCGSSSQVVQLASCFNLMLRLRMCGTISLLLNGLVAWTGKNFPFYCYVVERIVENILFLQEYRNI
jgi:hypothetical protein